MRVNPRSGPLRPVGPGTDQAWLPKSAQPPASRVPRTRKHRHRKRQAALSVAPCPRSSITHHEQRPLIPVTVGGVPRETKKPHPQGRCIRTSTLGSPASCQIYVPLCSDNERTTTTSPIIPGNQALVNRVTVPRKALTETPLRVHRPVLGPGRGRLHKSTRKIRPVPRFPGGRGPDTTSTG